MRKALAVLSYNRDRYFELVLPSILHQRIAGRSVSDLYDIYFFQDGLWENEPEHAATGHRVVANTLRTLTEKYPVFQQEKNLGVALHFDFVERLLFEQKGYDFVAFFEDDLVLAPGYIQALDLMADKFDADPRVGMVSAHPSDPTLPLLDQKKSRHEFATMGHNWGFGLSRTFWQRRQPFVDCYLDLLKGSSYRNRPHKLIWNWLEAAGFSGAASSQDYVKQCGTFGLGACRISTKANFGLPIGRSGLHCKPELFKEMGFDSTVVCDEPITTVADLSDGDFKSLYSKQGHEVGGQPVLHELADHIAWESRLLKGQFHPMCIMPGLSSPANPSPVDSARPVKQTASRTTESRAASVCIKSPTTNMPISKTHNVSHASVMNKLYGENVWNGFAAGHAAQDVQGWNGNHPVFAKLVKELRPRIVFDVGVWKGLSSITLARSLREAGLSSCVVSIDTFLGSPEHWSRERGLFQRKHGYPDLYDQFMSNVFHAGFSDVIVPMPQLSQVAAKLLGNMGIRAQLIHIDAAHEYDEVLKDATAFWEVLDDGGVMIGDDYHPSWPGVVRAANEFAGEVGRQLHTDAPKWFLRK